MKKQYKLFLSDQKIQQTSFDNIIKQKEFSQKRISKQEKNIRHLIFLNVSIKYI
ncbi:hypothetical protein pb186bvf_009053 [Paramecium bursaria]